MKYDSKKEWTKHIIACIVGNLLISVGVSLAKIASLGNDPFNGMCMSVSSFFNINYPLFTWGLNLTFFVFELIWGRKYIHIGTFLNWFMISYFVSAILKLYGLFLPTPESFAIRIPVLVAGVVICSLGIALYQFADLGVSPYDVLPIMFCDTFKKFPYFWARIIEDGVCVIGILLTFNAESKLLGIGTVIFALGMGPIIHLFTNILKKSEKK